LVFLLHLCFYFFSDWNIKRNLSKINYRIHTDAIKQNLVPKALSKQQTTFIYATEADVLNMALFGKTAKQLLNQLKNSL
jgi:hypothetical protein